ncbi:undecaprenyl-diphosphate phosphatase [bacterium]|nr:undecaprenyl-diphosphate phosphatase [bacterium]
MFFSIIILAIIQGIAEFLPISSSGHLVLGKALLNFNEPGATMEVFLHFGTLLSILVFYRKRIYDLLKTIFKGRFKTPDGKEFWLIIWASIPAGIIGFIGNDFFESLFSSTKLVSITLMITGLFLISTYWAKNKGERKFNLLNAIIIGIAQAFAIIPGISRSGATITVALWMNIDSKRAAEFSFLLAIPALFGAMLLKTMELFKSHISIEPALFIGVIISAVVGYFSLTMLIPILRKGKFWIFGIYCLALGIVGTMIIG